MLAFLFAAALAVARIHASQVTMDAKIRDDSDLSQFYQLLEASQVANTTLTYRHVTVFAPTNRAFQKYNGSTKNLVLYHMSNRPLTIEELRDSISSELEGNPPLWITRRPGKYSVNVYINNAMILLEQSNFQSKLKVNGDTMTQVLHIINEVLEPVRSNSAESPIYNPNAFQFLNQSENLNLGDHRVRTFRQRIVIEKKEAIFKAEGRFTFFIPVDEGFKPEPRPQKIDQLVIDGHVLPNEVLFTAPTPDKVPYPTLVFNDNLRVVVSFLKSQNKVYVQSDTLVGDTTHQAGVVLAEIVKANIPVRNGVVHLIQRPLMVVDSTVKDFLESFKEKEDGPVYKFYETIRDFGDDIMSSINHLTDVTLFAPSNDALDEPGVKQMLQDKKRIKEILKLHYVKERLTLEKIKDKSVSQKSFGGKPSHVGVPTAADKKKLYFNVVQGPRENQTVTVEGGGVNATIITPNIAATNGIIHIIDRVLGVPYTTVLDKLRTDPMLNSTYLLGQRRGFNDQLNDTTKRFTYFAPLDYAWKEASNNYPSTTKKLFMPEYSYHTKQILERHLVIADQAFTMAKLREISNDTLFLPAARDILKLRVKEYGETEKHDENAIRPEVSGYTLEWEGKRIRVVRPDVECTNGIIHVISAVFLKDSDVRVTGGASLATLAPHLIMILIAKWHL
ncbi:fasciclin-1 isoform X2 [Temnothorax curvispinosus]|uniref:Fasciclin-1 isoform X2 n=1 Tax=Temnothorax curvispinosus TaxID=300111 RepID=A0A6J1Q7P6_9HYME|nr:fasciclin-1 isoform X2 [Temnothorax curvispinosus]